VAMTRSSEILVVIEDAKECKNIETFKKSDEYNN
jgi:hypothetical protein